MSVRRLPVRLVDRLVLEMQLSSCAATQAAIRLATDRAVPLNRPAYLLLVLRCDRRFHAGSASQGSQAEGISVSAVAASFDQPFETARRHINELIEDGICERRGLRVRVRAGQMETPAFGRLMNELHDIMVRLVDKLLEAGVRLPPERERHDYDRNATIAAAIDLVLAAYEYAAPHYMSWLQMRVMSAIAYLNGGAIAADPVLAEHYAFEIPPPDEMLNPASASAVARLLGMSEATARRQVRVALDSGLVRRQGNGVIVPASAQSPVDAVALQHQAVQRALKSVERMAPSGFRFSQPSGNYVEGPPPSMEVVRRLARMPLV